LNNTERTGGVFDYVVDRSDDDETAGEVKNDDPAFPRHCKICALARWCLDDTTVDDMENGSEEAEEVDLEGETAHDDELGCSLLRYQCGIDEICSTFL
jgi:hypothetical protein